MYRRQEHRAYEVVQILKNDLLNESPDSDIGDPSTAENIPTNSKLKKSLFATLIKKKNGNVPKMKITKKIETCSTIKFNTDSGSEHEIEQFPLSGDSEMHQSSIPNVSGKGKRRNFFQKIINRSKYEKANSKKSTSSHDEVDYSNSRILKNPSLMSAVVVTAYIPKHNIKLINGINELQHILENAYNCEEHMIFMIKKYIEDKNFQKQLLQTCYEYFALQYNAKCQTNILANGLWIQQVEIMKIHEYNVQNRLNQLVKTNRNLQFEIESLCRYSEKFAARVNIYPKRFLHMRSFGKTYARHLIENNKKLQNKCKTLTTIISDFEQELHKLHNQKSTLEEEKRNCKVQIYHLEGVLERHTSNYELERTVLISRLNNQNKSIEDCERASRHLFQDLATFELQMRELNIHINWPNFIYQDASLIELIYQIRTYTGELLAGLISAYRDATAIARDVTKLRNTNARLQENLQKSTNELDNLSKQLEKQTKESDRAELKFTTLHQENVDLKSKLESITQEKINLQDQFQNLEKIFNQTKVNINEISTEKAALCKQLEELLWIVAPGNDEIQDFTTDDEKFEYFRIRYTQVAADAKRLNERCQNLEEENQNLLQFQQTYQQDLNGLQEGISVLSSENDILKKQLANEQQTLGGLQNERIKYLEEKNILKAIFQHLKSEISRVQHLEGAVADMNKEANRLALIAEFNKQLGEQLKNEVQIKENTIIELRQSLEKLSHIQLDNDREKMSLCAQLSEVSNVKEKLSNCLEVEVKKNHHLDESKRKIENSTKSQLRIFEEMQRNERAAVKELLKDFKGLIKQRDYLVYLQEQSKKKNHQLGGHLNELKKQHETALMEITRKGDDIKNLMGQLEEQQQLVKLLEDENRTNKGKCEKSSRKLEKLITQLRKEKDELETTNIYLKNNIQKICSDLDEARKTETEVVNKLSMKTAEVATLEATLEKYKNDLQSLSQENGKMQTELDYLNKMNEKQSADMQSIVSQLNSKDSTFLESQTSIINKNQEINELNMVIAKMKNDLVQWEQECNRLRKENESQNKIMIGYENQLVLLQDLESTKSKSDKEQHNLHLEHKSLQNELQNAKQEVEKLKCELETQIMKNESDKTFYKNQTHELLLECNVQKEHIEEEIANISKQLQQVTDNLVNEQKRSDELTRIHEDLKFKFNQMRDGLNAEIAAHKETCNKLQESENAMRELENERDDLQRQIHMLVLEINEEKDANIQLATENSNIKTVLEQGHKKYGILVSRNSVVENELKDVKHELETTLNAKDLAEIEINKNRIEVENKTMELKAAEETITCLTKEFNENQKLLFDLKEDYFKLQQQVTGLEFQNCELTLKLHEAQGKLETERNLYKEMKEYKCEVRQPAMTEGDAAPPDCGELFY